MSISQRTHRYTPLPGPKWLRLLRILSVHEEEAVCSLEAFDMARLPMYDCLSYTWGDPMSRDLYPPDALQNEMSAICDKQFRHTDGSIIRVTENLVQALKRLAEFGYVSSVDNPTPQYLWIDAICINQGDNVEKSSQVAMMDVIYSHAETVVVWLGEEDFHTAGALKTMKALGEVDFNKFEQQPYFDDYDAFTAYDTLIEAGKTFSFPNIEAGEWRDYAAFLQRKWFERIWVLQEKVFAKNTEVFVGPHNLSWNYIIEAASVLKQSGLANPLQALYLFAIDGYDYYRNGTVSRLFEDRLNNYQIFADISQSATTPTTLETLLYYSKRLNATQPLDHIYAILGIWNSMRDDSLGIERIQVDYTASVTDVYAGATVLAIRESGNLGILSLVESRPSLIAPDLPSWVPDYGQKAGILPLIPWPRVAPTTWSSNRWNASGGLAFGSQFETLSRKLPVQGFVLDVIEDLGPTYQQIDREYQWADLLQVLLHGYIRGQVPGRPSSYEGFWRTLIKNSFRHQTAGNEAEEAFAALVVDRTQGLYAQVRGLKESIQILQANKGDSVEVQEQTNELHDLEPLLGRIQRVLQKLSERVPPIPTWSGAFGQCERDTKSGAVMLEGSKNDDMDNGEYRTASMLRDIESSFWAAYSGRRLFRTKTGFFGISNQVLQEGDSVWILAGAETPFVLRNKTGNEWMNVGEAYVHGVMEGEATEKLPDPLSNILLI